jgi:hypothetical protein
VVSRIIGQSDGQSRKGRGSHVSQRS